MTMRLFAFESPSGNFGDELQAMEPRFFGRLVSLGVEPHWV
jgi:hypothetical protein